MKDRPPTRIRGLDGLRGVFSLLVFAGHVYIQKLAGGVIAVDLFFVLSGYLITALLLKEYAKTGRISLHRFYARRMLRLYPALVVVVIVSFIPAQIDHIEHPIPDSIAALFYMTNIWEQFQHGFYINLILQTWSLGVEEQFYLCWPVVLILCLRKERSLIGVLVAAMVVCFGLTGAIYHAHLSFVPVLQWLPTTQGPEFAAGSLLAVLQLRTNLTARLRPLVGWPVGLAAFVMVFVVTFHGMQRWWMFGGVTLIALPLIAHLALIPDGWMSKVLSFRPAVWLGERSYGFYLIQIPVLNLLSRSVHNHIKQVLIGLPLTLLLTELSWACVEQPFLRIKGRFSAPGVSMVASDPAPATAGAPAPAAAPTSGRLAPGTSGWQTPISSA